MFYLTREEHVLSAYPAFICGKLRKAAQRHSLLSLIYTYLNIFVDKGGPAMKWDGKSLTII